MFHISKKTCRQYTGASPRRTIRGIAGVRLKIHHPIYRDLQNEKHDHPHSPPSEVDGVRIVVISFQNIANFTFFIE